MGKHEELVRTWIIEYCCRNICSIILQSQNYKQSKAFEMYRDILTDLLQKQEFDTLPQTHQIWLVFVELLTRLNDKDFVLEEDGAMFDLLDDTFKFLHEKLLISKIQCICLITSINQVRLFDNQDITEKSEEVYASLKKDVYLIVQDFLGQMGPSFLNQVYEIYGERNDVDMNNDEEDDDVSERVINEENDQEDDVVVEENDQEDEVVADDTEHELDAVINDEDDTEQDLDAVIRRRNVIEDQSMQHEESFRILDEPEAEQTQNDGREKSAALNTSRYSLRSDAKAGKSLSPVTKPGKMLEAEMKDNLKTPQEKSAYDADEETVKGCGRRGKRNRRVRSYSSHNVALRSSSSNGSDQDELKEEHTSRYNLRSNAKSGNILSPVAKPDKKLDATVRELRRASRLKSDYFDEEEFRQYYRKMKMGDRRVREWLSQHSTLCSSSSNDNDMDGFDKQSKNEKGKQTQNENRINYGEGWKTSLSKSPHSRRHVERGRSLNVNRLTNEEQSMAPRKRKAGPFDETGEHEPRRTKVVSHPDNTNSGRVPPQPTSSLARKPQAPPEEEAASVHDVNNASDEVMPNAVNAIHRTAAAAHDVKSASDEVMPNAVNAIHRAAAAASESDEEDLDDSSFLEAYSTAGRMAANKKRRPFSREEVTFLMKGVKRFGVGSWAKILKEYRFNNRSSVQLKDKWRNLLKKYNAN